MDFKDAEELFNAVVTAQNSLVKNDTEKKLNGFKKKELLEQYLADLACAFTSGESDQAPFDFGLIFKGAFVTDHVRRVCFNWVNPHLKISTHYMTALQTVRGYFLSVCSTSIYILTCWHCGVCACDLCALSAEGQQRPERHKRLALGDGFPCERREESRPSPAQGLSTKRHGGRHDLFSSQQHGAVFAVPGAV